jgi:hypothetical protein
MDLFENGVSLISTDYDHDPISFLLNGYLGYPTILVGGLEHFLFFHILGIVIPTDFHIFQRI